VSRNEKIQEFLRVLWAIVTLQGTPWGLLRAWLDVASGTYPVDDQAEAMA